MALRARLSRRADSSDSRSPVRDRKIRSASYGRDELLDVNALKLSHSYHSKPPQDHKLVRTVLLRTLLFPGYLGWWKQQVKNHVIFESCVGKEAKKGLLLLNHCLFLCLSICAYLLVCLCVECSCRASKRIAGLGFTAACGAWLRATTCGIRACLR